jgi:ATP-dependent exoDNAse (exonuclease V) beta subunit
LTSIVDWFGLNDEQEVAATAEADEILVTAGAGSGKTRTLVARYVWLLESGLSMRQIAAITFTEKAAREMRNRVRSALSNLAHASEDPDERQRWTALEAGIDAARIGTIHSLCAEILRAHPAEAGVDPLFEVMEEGRAAAARARAVEDALAWAMDDPTSVQLYLHFKVNSLRKILSRLLQGRLDAHAWFEREEFESSSTEILAFALDQSMGLEEIQIPLRAIQSMRDTGSLEADAGALIGQIDDLLTRWDRAKASIQSGAYLQAAQTLFDLRRDCMGLRGGPRDSQAKEELRALREAYDVVLGPWLGGGKKDDVPPDPEAEVLFAELLPSLRAVYLIALAAYRSALDENHQLDFDDLEQGAMELLRQAPIRERWSQAIQVVLIDEFQDTNERQRQIVEALTGNGQFFVVGDARQSIYRFRGADVTVFRGMKRDVETHEGKSLSLNTTFRSHAALLRGLDALLPLFMGELDDEIPLYQVPYSRLDADRLDPLDGIQAPHLQIVVGLGERAADARVQAADALARYLQELRGEGQFQSWDQVTLLFRAASGFPAYEQAFAAYGIPFLTIAGSGFYERPEIRDVLNILHAIAVPWDDVALAGLLRSPAFGLTDASLYRLRWGPEGMRRLSDALQNDLGDFPEVDKAVVERVNVFLEEMVPLVERVPIAELLKQMIDRLDYRSILASRGERLWRNLDKLLEDARASGLVRVSAFFEYLRTLREAGVRQGEAPAEALGAVRLMTIHKAKGLEFDIVVLADASRQRPNRSDPVYLLPELGLAVNPEEPESIPLRYAISRWYDELQSEAEENRILYVACTRAREKLIISGHLAQNRGNWTARGWMKTVLEHLGVTPDQVAKAAGRKETLKLSEDVEVGLNVAEPADLPFPPDEIEAAWPESQASPIMGPLELKPFEGLDPDLARDPERAWRATGGTGHPPAAVVGSLVHSAIGVWLFPGDPELTPLLESEALSAGLVEPGQRARALREAGKLLERLRVHELYAEISAAEERYHEIPYSRPHPSWGSDSGRIDLLYRVNNVWHLMDFKSDEIRDEDDFAKALDEHRPQIGRYTAAVQQLWGETPQAALCFLDAMGEVKIVFLEG